MRFSLTTLGCKANQYDSAALAVALASAGFVHDRGKGTSAAPAGLVVVNTCCVTTTAMAKSRQAIARAARGSPRSFFLITGCYTDYDARRVRSVLENLGVAPQRFLLAGHHDNLAATIDIVRRRINGSAPPSPAPLPPATPATLKARRKAALGAKVAGVSGLPGIASFPSRQRAIVKVQDGCDAFCAYCVVPFIRCRVRSRGPEEIERECRRLVAAGHKEIVLCGVFLGAYGRATAIRRKWTGTSRPLLDLIERIAAIEGLWRLRLSSLESGDLDEEFLARCKALPNFAPHFHLPLQSGSDRILRAMNRRYSAGDFLRAADALRQAFDRPAITTDIIVGYPGEDEEDFAATLNLARRAGFTKIHAFPFSAIEGTAAWDVRHRAAPPDVVRQRMSQLAEIERDMAYQYRRQFIGREMEALVESARTGKAGTHLAMTGRYLKVEFVGEDVRAGNLVRLVIEGAGDKHLQGRLLTVLKS